MTQFIDNGDSPDLLGLVPKPKNESAYKVHCRTLFSNAEAWLAWLNTPSVRADSWTDVRSTAPGGDAWAGGSWDQAVKYCHQGWAAGAKRAAELRDRIEAKHPTGKIPPRWHVAGSFCSVPRGLTGSPLHMATVDTRRLRRRPIITLVSQFNALATFGADEFVRRSAVVAAVVDAVEAAGFSCQVISFGFSEMNEKCNTTAFTVKEAGEPSDIGRMVFGLGHPSVLRRFGFATYAAYQALKDWGSSMGRTVALSTSDVPDTYVLPSIQDSRMHGLFKNDERTVSQGLPAMIKALAQQGCPAFEQED